MQGINSPREPEIIQGGMGVGISTWILARAVATAGERLNKPVLGVVSGIGLATMLVLRLRKGDPDARRALKAFPVPEIAHEILEQYWLQASNSGRSELPSKPEVLVTGSEEKKALLTRLLIIANFAEVWLARQGHSGPIGINYLEKIQLPRLPETFGAMLGGVGYVLMGAGIPNQVPGILDDLAGWKETTNRIDVAGSGKHEMLFNPEMTIPRRYHVPLTRPRFLAIVSHHALAKTLARKSNGRVDGFVVEGPIAGGHNAPAREKEINGNGEPLYGERDEPNLAKIRALGKPFWLAGGCASPEKLLEAKRVGAVGVQIGSAFALCDESGMMSDIKEDLKRQISSGDLEVRADPIVSPSGFPFQVASLGGSLSDPEVYERRKRVCSFGYLVEAYKRPRGGIGFRCPAEPISVYSRKRGDAKKTKGRVCLCSGLAATALDSQRPEAPNEPPIVTLGKDQSSIANLLGSEGGSYSAEDVIRSILG